MKGRYIPFKAWVVGMLYRFLSAGSRIPVNENMTPFVQLTLEFRYVNLCRATNIVTVPAFRRLHCPKEHRR